ncbi:hypothetical protein Tco_0497848 [Tanacetum coccineum]
MPRHDDSSIKDDSSELPTTSSDNGEVIHVIGFDPHTFTHFRDERKGLVFIQVIKQSIDEKLGRTAFSDNFTGLELEDGGGHGTSGSVQSLDPFDRHSDFGAGFS